MFNLFKKKDGDEPPSDKKEEFVKHWFSEIEKAKAREKNFRKKAREAVKIYEPDTEAEVPYNILYSNTETLIPALYNNTPRPVVKRRYQRPDRVAALGSRVLESFLNYQIDTNGRDYQPFDDLIKATVLQALVPGRGVTWFKYDPTIEERKDAEGESYEEVTAQQVCWEEVSWDNLIMGYAKSWETVPWIARERFMSKAEVKENFPKLDLKEIKFDTAAETTEESDNTRPVEAKTVKLATVYEIWDKVHKRVIFLALGSKEALRVVDDPLKLTGFYPCPKPLQFYERTKGLVPIPIYEAYRSQADELNRITKRISALTTMLKVRGFYDGSVQGLDQVLQGDDGTLIPVDNVAAALQNQTLPNSIWLFPLETVITTLQQLHIQREAVKRTIYEINGIADIMRGSSAASETLGAQEIKNQWGTLRLKRMQKSVMMYVRESLRIVAEIGATQFNEKTFAAITGYDLPTPEMKAQMQQQMAMQQQQGVQIPPEVQQQFQTFMEAPTWEDVLAFLRNDPMRQYRIDIETNTTVDIEATEDKAQVGEFLNAMAQFLNGITPIVQQGVLPPEAAKEIMTAVVKRFRFGVEVEEALNKMTIPQPPPEQGKEAPAGPPQPTEADMAMQQTKVQAEQLKQQTLKMDFEFAQAEHQFRMEELQAKRGVLIAQTNKAEREANRPAEESNAPV